MKLYSVWYNSYGEDKNFGEVEGGGFNSEVLKKLKEGNSWMSDDSREYWVDGEGEGWKLRKGIVWMGVRRNMIKCLMKESTEEGAKGTSLKY